MIRLTKQINRLQYLQRRIACGLSYYFIKIFNVDFVQCVTFPRSGHHLLVNLLLKYFSRDIEYSNTDGPENSKLCEKVLKAGNFYYCEFYQHYQQTPCSNFKTNFQKNHDLDLKLKNHSCFKYIIQYRQPLDALASWYEAQVTLGELKDSRRTWELFAEQKIIFWRSFVKKWILHNQNKNTFYLNYETLTDYSQQALKQVINFIKPDEPIDENFFCQVFEKYRLKRRRRIEDFKYFNPIFFERIKQKVIQELRVLEYDK